MSGRPRGSRQQAIPVVRIISRLNVGGPAIQAITLTSLLERFGYRTALVRGTEQPREGNMDHVARRLGVKPVRLRSLRRNPGWHDVSALAALVSLLRRSRPRIVHTHAAKAGALGRLAALIACPSAVLVHTFHGHSLDRYFSTSTNRLLVRFEAWLARRTDRLIAVSHEVRDELVALGVAAQEDFDVVQVGLDLDPFLAGEPEQGRRRAALRRELGIPVDARVVTLVARLVPIKRVDRFLTVANLLASERNVVFLIVGDGELRDQLRTSTEARQLGDRVVWAGFRRDIPDVYFGSDVVVLTSDNEGTPVTLIEAQAAGVPVVSTKVGGVTSVVRHGETGWVVSGDSEPAMADAVRRALVDESRAARMGARGREHVTARFSLDRLVRDIDELYRSLLSPGATRAAGAGPLGEPGSDGRSHRRRGWPRRRRREHHQRRDAGGRGIPGRR